MKKLLCMLLFCIFSVNISAQLEEKKELSAQAGTLRVTSSGDQWASIWCVILGARYREICNYGQPIHDISVSPDGRYIAFSSDHNIVHVWDNDDNNFVPRHSINAQYHDPLDDLIKRKPVIKTADKIRALQKKINVPAVRRCLWSPDSKKLITLTKGLEREVWDTHTWQKLR